MHKYLLSVIVVVFALGPSHGEEVRVPGGKIESGLSQVRASDATAYEHLLYVARTRTCDHLLITAGGPASRFPDDIQGDPR